MLDTKSFDTVPSPILSLLSPITQTIVPADVGGDVTDVRVNVGLVIVLFVKVWVPVRVTTVESIAIVPEPVIVPSR